jgi:hypothetical protein
VCGRGRDARGGGAGVEGGGTYAREREHPGLSASIAMIDAGHRLTVLPFEVAKSARIVDVVSRAPRRGRAKATPVALWVPEAGTLLVPDARARST